MEKPVLSEGDMKRRPHGQHSRPVPDDFREIGARLSNNALRAHYGAGPGAIARWRRQTGVYLDVKVHRPNLQMPANFGDVAKGMTVGQAADHFRRSPETIRRWFGYAGISPRPTRFVPTQKVSRTELDSSVSGQAAQHLRRFYSSVHRADIRMQESGKTTWGSERGLPDAGRGQYFVSGLGVMPDYEMVGLARDHGFVEWTA